ncbi:MBL fold metallo-hydrolase [Pseudomonas luteola]|uniref:MBL fold metallo-hydrolase n=1 Tax=Pseudomonas luteola TaxID=47886 RepID=A0ABS0MZT1_PSELU|nr:MBL fold metallo-hydrolase [Pseudomonas luteola]MBH3441262.1 MBL fold metallo-hydrolase [Pseudomonas luteola]
MRIHHLNCGCMCPWGGALFDGFSKGLTGHLVCHCLLIETDNDDLVLVDTGFGARDVHAPHKRLSGFFIGFNNIQFEMRYTAIEQIRQLGFQASDVRHIVLTHLDFDHAGGLEDFPDATVHVLEREISMARLPHGYIGKRRYRFHQWDQVRRWELYEPQGEAWYGFSAVRDLKGLPPEILMIPLAGHTWGHAGVAIQTPTGWLLHAGDAYFYREEVGQPKRSCTPGLRFYQTMMEVNRELRLRNQQRLRELSLTHKSEVELFCSHDAKELERCQQSRPTELQVVDAAPTNL